MFSPFYNAILNFVQHLQLNAAALCSLLALLLITTCSLQDADANSNTDWMKAGKYGIFFHYLPSGPDFEKRIDSFDVESFAKQMDECGPAYVFITLGQNSGYYCSPNAVYEGYIGCKPNERCSKRDLPMDLAKALSKYHIRLMLYLPSRSPQADAQAMSALSDTPQDEPAPQEFTRKWSEIIREWSIRYSKRISGWWFDGAYNTAGWDDHYQAYNWSTWADACRAGNKNSILAFNPGTDIKKAFSALCEEQDYTAGEQNDWSATPQQFPVPTGLQWHILSFLGSHWAAADGPKQSDQAMIDYIRTVNTQGGVVTMDVNVSPDGKVYPPALEQLRAIKTAIRGN